MIAVNAKQLSSYGGSLETAVSDLEHYRATGSAVLLLCAGEIRANNLRHLLEEREKNANFTDGYYEAIQSIVVAKPAA